MRALILLFVAVLIGNNVAAQFRPRVSAEFASAAARLESFRGWPSETDVFILERDPIGGAYYNDVLNHEFRRFPPPRFLVPSLDSAQWKAQFARRALHTWQSGAEVWVTKRAWAKNPQRGWYWVDGDVSVRWTDVTGLLGRLQTDGDAGGADGFAKIANSPSNREILDGVLKPG
jgi:hypothetical protein